MVLNIMWHRLTPIFHSILIKFLQLSFSFRNKDDDPEQLFGLYVIVILLFHFSIKLREWQSEFVYENKNKNYVV